MNDPTLGMHFATSLQTLGAFLTYFGSALVATLVFVRIYVTITPYREFQLIRDGNAAAATSFCGALVGFVLPLASAIINSVSLPDMLVWAGVALVVQLIALLLVRLVTPGVFREIEAGRAASAILLAGVSIALGILNAACMTW
ncbi:DUF350 domain-containing protein [soil metagenome]